MALRSLSRAGAAALAALLVSGIPVGHSEATATTVLQLSDRELVQNAECIVLGTVSDVRVLAFEGAPGLFTEVRVAVEEVLSGRERADVVLRLPGGRDGAHAIVVEGMPEFAQGETVLLFLARQPTGAFGDEEESWIPVGLEQGVWRSPDGDEFSRRHAEGLFRPGAPLELGSVSPVLTLDEIRALLLPPRAEP